MNVSRDILLEREVRIKRDDIWEKSLIKKYGKKKAKKKTLSKGGRRVVVKLKDQVIEKIRSMLIPMITSFREKIMHEDTLKKITEQKVANK